MNSDRRHELQENELANYLSNLNTKIEPYSKVIALGVGALILAAVGIALMRSRSKEQQSDATLTMIMQSTSGDAEAFGELADKYPSTAAASWARLTQADLHCSEGIAALYTDRTEGVELLEDAAAEYKLAAEGSSDALLASRAHYGAARVAEALGKIDDAIASYKLVIEDNESEAMVAKAQSRIDSLEKPLTKEFLTWFEGYKPTTGDPSLPPGLPGLDDLPEDSTFQLPKLNFGGGDMPAENDSIAVPTDEEAAEAAPAEGEEMTVPEATEDPAETVELNEPAKTEPAETEPAKTEPAETEPAETEPAETEPVETEPAETQPAETEPAKTEPAKTEPAKTEPAKTEPAEASPEKPEATESAAADDGAADDK